MSNKAKHILFSSQNLFLNDDDGPTSYPYKGLSWTSYLRDNLIKTTKPVMQRKKTDWLFTAEIKFSSSD